MATEIKTIVTLVFRPDAVLEVSVQEKLEKETIEHYKSMGYTTLELELGIPYSEEWVRKNQSTIIRQKGRLI